MRALIVEDGGQRSALAAVRALGRAGWKVGVASPVAGMAAHSRFALWHEVPRAEDAGYIDGLLHAVQAGGYEVVMAAGDGELLAVTAGREPLEAAGARVAHPPYTVVLRAIDKLRLAAAAERVGLAAPRTELDVPPDWSGPMIVKERVHGEAGSAGKTPHTPAVVVHDRAEAADRLRAIAAHGGQGVVQQVIEGGLMAVSALVDDDSRVRALVAQRAAGLWPADAGPSVRAEVVAISDELRAGIEALLVELRWTGLVQLQFLVPDDGVPRLIDFNGRIYGSIALTEAAGVPMVAAWAALATGRHPPPLPPARIGTRYQWLEGDLRRALVERRRGLPRDLFATLAYARGAVSSVPARDDLSPEFYVLSGLVRRSAKKAFSRWT